MATVPASCIHYFLKGSLILLKLWRTFDTVLLCFAVLVVQPFWWITGWITLCINSNQKKAFYQFANWLLACLQCQFFLLCCLTSCSWMLNLSDYLIEKSWIIQPDHRNSSHCVHKTPSSAYSWPLTSQILIVPRPTTIHMQTHTMCTCACACTLFVSWSHEPTNRITPFQYNRSDIMIVGYIFWSVC